jgi:hypothetical protein
VKSEARPGIERQRQGGAREDDRDPQPLRAGQHRGVQVGDTVYFHVTNIEQDWDILHGFAVLGAQTPSSSCSRARRAR